MISPRRTRLLIVPDLQSFQRVIARTACHADAWYARACAVIVPTRAAADHLRRTLEHLVLGEGRVDARRALALPELLTRDDWYERLHERLPGAPSRLSEFERDVCGHAATREAVQAGVAPPFKLRPGLVAEMLRLYDEVGRQGRTIDVFERLLTDELQPSAEVDRGARRLLRQTRFLVATFRAYERRVAAAGRLDEQRLRELLRQMPAVRPFRHVVVTVPDRAADTAGLWPADFDLLARLPGLERVDVIATERLLDAGFRERLHDLLPGIDEVREHDRDTRLPVLIASSVENHTLYFTHRDREEELMAVARSVKPSGIGDQTAVVFQRPLPYLYLARHLFGRSGVPFQALDALPLAAEPYAAAVDLVLTFVTSEYTRESTVELLQSPHFVFEPDGRRRVSQEEVAALDRQLREAHYPGGRGRLARLATEWAARRDATGTRADEDGAAAHAAGVAASLARQLSVLDEERPASVLLDVLLGFLRAHQALLPASDPLRERQLRARAAIHGALQSLSDAHAQHDDPRSTLSSVAATIHRWIEGQTFAPRAGTAGLHLIDAQAARYGDFTQVSLVGLVDGEWPERPRRNIFYPRSLLGTLGWPRDTERLRAARATFQDLLRLPTERLVLSTFLLEEDTIVGPSTLLEEIGDVDLPVQQNAVASAGRVSVDEALSSDPVVPWALKGDVARWLALRLARSPAQHPQFHGSAGPRVPSTYGVRSVERYLECPFKYFAASVLHLEEEPEDEPTMTPRAHGLLVHEAFRKFFEQWQRAGGDAITPDNLGLALREFGQIAEELLAGLPERDRALERTRLLGSPTAVGLADRLFRLEAENPGEVLERLLEYPIEGEFELRSDEGTRRVHVRGTADRIDLLADGTLRVIDYKAGGAPKPTRAIQLPVYGACAEQLLDGRHGRTWKVREAGYVAFGDRRTFVSIAGRGDLPSALAMGQGRFVKAVDGIERGEFPPRPDEKFLCLTCHYSTVCRKDYAGGE